MHAWIRLFGMITQQSVTTLMKTVDASVATGTTKLHMLFSSSGGNVFCGLSTYNYLKALPIQIATYNVSQVDSIAVPIFCAGAERFCTHNGRFMIHEVTYFANAGQQLTLRTLRAIHASILSDTNAIAKVIAATTGKAEAEVFNAMDATSFYNADESFKLGLSTEIGSPDYKLDQPFTSIYEDGSTSKLFPSEYQMSLPMAPVQPPSAPVGPPTVSTYLQPTPSETSR